jgi:surface protein
MEYAFSGCANLSGSPSDNFNLTGVTDLESMFKWASAFNSDLSGWDTGSVTNMGYMFYTFYREPLAFDQNLGGWDVNSLTSAGSMFTNTALSTANYDALLIGWDAQALQPGVEFDGGESTCCTGESARTNMINNDGWTITDDGKDCSTP